MIGVSVTSNIGTVRARFQTLTEGLQKRAVIRALNRALDNTATTANREIRKVYKVRAAVIARAMKKNHANGSSIAPAAELVLRGARIGLINFGARAVNPWNVKGRQHNRRGGGVSVQIKVSGGRKLIRGAFIAASTANNAQGGGSKGRRQVWRRISYASSSARGIRWHGLGGWRINAGASIGAEEPIISLHSISVPAAFRNRVVLAATERAAREVFVKTLQQQIKFLGGGNGAID